MPRGFIVHAYADYKRNRILLAGRLEDGRSFAAAARGSVASLLVPESTLAELGSRSGLPRFAIEESGLSSFEPGQRLLRLRFAGLGERRDAAAALRAADIPSPDADTREADAFLLEAGIRGPVLIEGSCRPGRNVDLVFDDPVLGPADPAFRAPLVLASIDIETDTKSGAIRAVSLAVDGGVAESRVPFRNVRVLAPGRPLVEDAGSPVVYHDDEASLLAAFASDLRTADPDAITGWNVLDFDIPHLAERFAALRVPFAIGRSLENARFLPGEGRRSAAAIVPGRQVIDALRAVRAGPVRYEDFTLQTVANAVLGEGKIVKETGEEKIAALDRLYAEDPASFGAYCLADSELVLRILDRTGLFRLAVERAALTGVSLDKAWTSVASFERAYAAELRALGVAPPPRPTAAEARAVSGAAGGTVLDAVTGLFANVAVFDFRSLYPSIIRTFNVDPWTRARAAAGEGPVLAAPNGALFVRDRGPLPRLIDSYFAERTRALESGDEVAAFVFKILMNSFYGCLGTPTCRYGKTELAGAITSFARKWLLFSRDWFVSRGYRVLYGDTDSLFVELGRVPSRAEDPVDGTDLRGFDLSCGSLASALNEDLSAAIRAEYDLPSFLSLRFEKAYRRFLIPPIRALAADGSSRGRAKGYAGLLLDADGGSAVEVKGMEAVRSDSTPFARRLQLELLALVFGGAGEAETLEFLRGRARELHSGSLDAELVYRRRLVRPPEAYLSSVPPQVKVARALGWKGRRGVVEYVWTSSGAESAASPSSPLDRNHYLTSQLLPFAESLFLAARWDAARLRTAVLGSEERQMELGL
ncbi:MAG TPA: DNA polymerase II [Treponema sp.]|nr:MAG: hypothetical protein A2001_04400 [Treponema sp. GWC1_61_84]HCM27602.1 DNA polymerase II [Treponema sp.]